MDFLGKPIRAYGAFIFSRSDNIQHIQELALASLVWMSTGKLFIHHTKNYVLDSHDPILAYLWFEYLLYTTDSPVSLSLHQVRIQNHIKRFKEKEESIRYPLVSVGYESSLEYFYSAIKPEWTPLPHTQENINGYVLKYRTARTKLHKSDKPELYLSDPAQLHMITTNELLQCAIGMALTLKEQDKTSDSKIKAGKVVCRTKENSFNKKTTSLYCAIR